MDINNTPFFLLRSEAELEHGSRRIDWRQRQQCLSLAQN